MFFQKKKKKKKKFLVFILSYLLNNSLIEQDTTQKHLGLTLDHKLTFQYHVNEKIKKAMKGIDLLRKLQSILPWTSLLAIYKSFIRTHLDYDDVVYNQPSNEAFSNKLETVQYNAALAITGGIKGTSREKLYQEFGLEYLQQRREMRRLSIFYKVLWTKLPAYIYDFILQQDNFRDIQTHLAHSLAERSILKFFFFLVLSVNGTS